MSSVAALSTKLVFTYRDVAQRQNIAAIDLDPEIENERRNLIALTALFAREKAVDSESAHTAIALLSLLPPDRAFPRLVADGEGGLVMIWEDAEESLMLTVDRRELFPVSSPATSNSHHLPGTSLKGDDIPTRLMCVIPPR